MNPPLRSQRLRFGRFVLDTRRVELLRDGTPVPLRPKAFALLALLAGNPGVVLGREALRAAVWPGVVVTDDSLTQAVREVRTALGDADGQLLRTVARHGYRFDAEVEPADDRTGAATRPAAAAGASGPSLPAPSAALARPAANGRAGIWWRRAGALVLAAAAGVAGVLGIETWTAASRGAPAPRLSLVVLPLDAEPGSDGNGWFSDSLTADLIADLGQVSGLEIVSRDTALTYKGRPADPRAVARELSVRHVVRGTVGRTGPDVRLQLALIDGETGRQRWAERFVLDRADLAGSLQDAAGVVSRALGVEVYRAEGQRARALGPGAVEADDLAMQGWALWLRGLSPGNASEALRLFEAAVAKDPDSLRGWAGVGLVNGQAASFGWVADPAPARARQREALLQMERIDGDDMLTHFARVDPYYRRQDFEGLLQHARRLVERFPSQPWGHHQLANAYLQLGRFDECLAPIGQALRLGPRDTLRPVWHGMAAFCHFAAGRDAAAVEEARRAVLAGPTQPGPQMMLAAALAGAGQADAAQVIVREFHGHPMFRMQSLARLFPGTAPALVAGRERLFGTLRDLGVP